MISNEEKYLDLDFLAQGVYSNDVDTVVLCVNRLCDLWLSNETEFQEDDFLAAVSVRRLLELFGRDECPQLQNRVVKIIGHFCDDETRPDIRDELIELGLLRSLARVAERLVTLGLAGRNVQESEVSEGIAVILKAILCSNGVSQQIDVLMGALAVLRTLLRDESVLILTQACWSLRRISDLRNEACAQRMLDLGILDRLIDMINMSPDPSLISNALVIMNGITELRPQTVIDSGALQALRRVLCDDRLNSDATLVYDVLSTIADYSKVWMEAVASAGLVPFVLNLLHSEDEKIREQAADIVGHITQTANDEQIAQLIGDGVLLTLSHIILNRPRTDNVTDAIRLLEDILDPAKKRTQIFAAAWESSERPKFISHLTKLKGEDTRTNRLTLLQRIVEFSASNALLQTVVDAELLPVLVDLLHSEEVELQKRAAYAIHKVAVRASHAQVIAFVQAGVLTSLTDTVLYCPNVRTIIESMHALDIILDGSKERSQVTAVWESTEKRRLVLHLQGLIDEMKSDSTTTVLQLVVEYSDSRVLLQTLVDSDILVFLVQMLRSSDADMQRRTAQAVRKLAAQADTAQIGVLVEVGVLPALTDVLLNRPQAKTIEDAMAALQSILDVRKGRSEINIIWQTQEKVRLVRHLKQLAQSNKKNTRSTAVERIIEYSSCRMLLPAIIEAGLLPFLAESLRSKHVGMQKRAAFAVRKFVLVADNGQIAKLVSVGVWPPLIGIVIDRPQSETFTNALDALDSILMAVRDRSELIAVWEAEEKPKLVSHFSKLLLDESAPVSQQLVQYTRHKALLRAIIEAGIPAFLVSLLEHYHTEHGIVEDATKAVTNMLNSSKALNEAAAVWEAFDRLELLDHLERLQQHSDRWVRFCVEELIDRYCEGIRDEL